MATALQVFHNLGNLSVTVDKVMTNCGENLRHSIKNALDVSAIAHQQGKGKLVYTKLMVGSAGCRSHGLLITH